MLVRLEQRGIGPIAHDERELPCQVVRVLQPGVHPLRADGTVDVRSVAEQKAAAVAEARRASVMNPIRGKPGAALERERTARLIAESRHDGVESHVVAVAQFARKNADDAPMVLAAHREEQMKPIAPQVDVHLVCDHASRRLGVGHEKHVLIRCSAERDAGVLANEAACAVASCNPGSGQLMRRAVG